ncbi:MAG TPA: biotin transporter BioY [Clostridiales bacterium UBA8960]|jgi:biotin transport system substrate-specific component|nr:biotin transporter BioY [Clostridiales bacterium UBA8960]
MKTKSMILTALFASITAVMALLPAIPLPFSPVPITFQVLGVFLAGAILGSKLGFLSQVVYLCLGAIGLPVFAGGSGGFSVIIGPTGGYLIGFTIAAFIIGWLIEAGELNKIDKKVAYFLAFFAGIASIYVIGTLQLAYVLNLDLMKAFSIGSLPYLPLDALKIIIAFMIAIPTRSRLKFAKLI